MCILMYYLPERIFLCKFKYFAQIRTLARVLWASNPHCAVNDSNRDRKRLTNILWLIGVRYDKLIKN
jgi:hypothetical protein